MGRFIADPDKLMLEGTNINGYAAEFLKTVNGVYETIEDMVANDYISPEALTIKVKIDKCRPNLDEMQQTIAEYGNFCITAAGKVVRNQNDIIDNVNINDGSVQG